MGTASSAYGKLFPVKADLLLKYFSISSVLIYLGGVVFNVFVYGSFNINILSFIDWSESLLLFIPTLFSVLLLTSVTLFLFLLYYHQMIYTEYNFGIEDWALSKWEEWLIIIASVLLTILLMTAISNYRGVHYSVWIYLASTVVLVQLMMEALLKYLPHKKLSCSKIVLPLVVFLYTASIILYGREHIREIKEMSPRQYVAFTYKDSLEVASSNNLVFLLQTPRHIFLYNKRTEITQVYANEHMDNLRFSDKKIYSYKKK